MRGSVFSEAVIYSQGTPSETSGYSASDSRIVGLFSIRDICVELYKLIFDRVSLKEHLIPQHGLIVVSGSTDSCKSLVTRGLIDFYLDARRRPRAIGDWKRRPHLVTFEDPIEER